MHCKGDKTRTPIFSAFVLSEDPKGWALGRGLDGVALQETKKTFFENGARKKVSEFLRKTASAGVGVFVPPFRMHPCT